MCRICGSRSGNSEECYLLIELTFRTYRWRQYYPPKRRWTYAGLRNATCQKSDDFRKESQFYSFCLSRKSEDLCKECIGSKMCFISFATFVQNIFRSNKNLASYTKVHFDISAQTHIGLHTKGPLFLSNYNQNCNLSVCFGTTPQCKISWNSVQLVLYIVANSFCPDIFQQQTIRIWSHEVLLHRKWPHSEVRCGKIWPRRSFMWWNV
jgi:hypothetical protein